jgi:hypothetical protein
MYTVPKKLKVPLNVGSLNTVPFNLKNDMIENSLKKISEGKMSVVIDASDPKIIYNLAEPKILKKFGKIRPINSLEYILSKLKSLGELALKKYGKNFEDSRDPIMPVVICSSAEIEEVEHDLFKNRYYGYKGMLCITVVRKNSLKF